MSTIENRMSEQALSDWHEMESAQTYSGLVLKLEDNKIVVTDKKLITDTHDELLLALPERDCRYILWRYPGTTKIFFIFWYPDTATIRSKMLYTSLHSGVLNRCAHDVSITATDPDEVSKHALFEQVGT